LQHAISAGKRITGIIRSYDAQHSPFRHVGGNVEREGGRSMLMQSSAVSPSLLRQPASVARARDGLLAAVVGLVGLLLIGLALHFHSGSAASGRIAGAEDGAAAMHQFLFVP
jgi:hypothetical protein